MSINSPNDIEISDIFKINAYEYFIVQEIKNNEEIEGIIRDGILTFGSDQISETYEAERIIYKLNNDGWEYNGKFSYEGKDINGNPIE